ncbi:MAG: hypothetical protein H7A23_15290 [Leptospiraceae bacterium]|nr:hypothetical protein [Leptospiraceae bacterium]
MKNDVSKDFQEIKPSQIRTIVNKTHDLVGERLSRTEIFDKLEESNYDAKTIKKIVNRYFHVVYAEGKATKKLDDSIEKLIQVKKKEYEEYAKND